MLYSGENVKRLFKKFPIKYKEDKYYIHIRVCPFCKAEDYNFHYDKKQDIFYCDKCNQKKNIWDVQKKLGLISDVAPIYDKLTEYIKKHPNGSVEISLVTTFVNNLQKNKNLLNKLNEKFGISPEILEAYKIGYTSMHLVVPYWYNGQCVKTKFINLLGGLSYYFVPDNGVHLLFNQDNCKNFDSIIICETEIDALALIEQDIRNVVALESEVHRFYPEWYNFLKSKSKITLIFRNTEISDYIARKLSRQIGKNKVIHVKLPVENTEFPVVEYLKQHTAEELHKLLEETPPYHIENVVHVQESADMLEDHLVALNSNDEKRKIRMPWDELEKLYGGLYGGRMIILSGVPKVGKTTFALNICKYNAEREHPVLHFCVEMPPYILTQKLISSEFKKPFSSVTVDDVYEFRQKFRYFPLYFGYRPASLTVKTIMKLLRDAIPRYGIELVVFDHLHFLCRSERDTSQLVSLASRGFKMLAEEFNIPIILLAQPRKLKDDSPPTANDLKDTASLWQDADDIIIIHRDRLPLQVDDTQSILSDETLIRVDASRLGSGGQMYLYFHTAYGTFMTKDEYEKTKKVSEPPADEDDEIIF